MLIRYPPLIAHKAHLIMVSDCHFGVSPVNYPDPDNVVTLKMRSRSPKSNHFFPRPTDISVLVWSNSSHWFKR